MRLRCLTVMASVAASTLTLLLISPIALAQHTSDYPYKPIRIVVPEAPGGATDIQARMFSAKMSQALGQQFVVDNRSGGGAAGLATALNVARANADGYTLMAVTPSFTFTPALRKDYPIDPIKDFAPVALLTRAPYLLVVNASVPAKSTQELIALARAEPGKLNFGAGNVGSGTHLVTLWFLDAANIKATYIPYKSTGLAMLDLTAGRLDGTLANVLSSGPMVRSGRLRALGISTEKRSKFMPELPTLIEQGVTGYNASTFHGYLAPAHTPPAIINRLAAEYSKAIKSPDIIAKIDEGGGEAIGSTPAQFAAFIANEVTVWRNLVKRTGLQIDE